MAGRGSTQGHRPASLLLLALLLLPGPLSPTDEGRGRRGEDKAPSTVLVAAGGLGLALGEVVHQQPESHAAVAAAAAAANDDDDDDDDEDNNVIVEDEVAVLNKLSTVNTLLHTR